MKRVRSACILQTLKFFQKEELGYDRDTALSLNEREYENYTSAMVKNNVKFQIVNKEILDDGSVLVHVKKQYGENTDVSEYFD